LLYTIEKATRQPITHMQLPSGEAVTAHRIDQFKQQINQVFDEAVDLSFFNDLLADMSHQQSRSPEELASALAYMLQKDRPLQVQFAPVKDAPAAKTKAGRERDGRGVKPRANDSELQRYRLEVGRNQDVRPGDIVGAIANEGGIQSQFIGHIKLFDEFTTVDLPKDLPPQVLQLLKKVRVRNHPLNISEDRGPRGEEAPKAKLSRKPDPKPEGKRGKPASKGKADGKPKTKLRQRDQKNKGYRAKKV